MNQEEIENRITELEDIGNRDGLTIGEFAEYQELTKELSKSSTHQRRKA